jgi:predicted protein tyrosine phosphatase
VIAHIEGSRLIPLGTLCDYLAELPKDKEILIHCKSGMRSAKAVPTRSVFTPQGMADRKSTRQNSSHPEFL